MSTRSRRLEAMPYHVALVEMLRKRYREMWDWFAQDGEKSTGGADVKVALLKSTYRLSQDGHPALYEQAARAMESLGLAMPVTCYQSQEGLGHNACIYDIGNEAHVVFAGNLMSLLGEEEMVSVLAHEFAHLHLTRLDGGVFGTMLRVIGAMAQSGRAKPSHLETARRCQLYMEIYCDRGSFVATGDAGTVVRGLVKLQTGMGEVNAESYLAQAEEIFAQGAGKSDGMTHPESFIRARAVDLWSREDEKAAEEIGAMIEGQDKLDDLDLLGQERLCGITRSLLADLLAPEWFRTDPVLAHARLFFGDFNPGESCVGQLKEGDTKTKEYLSYVLLDFAVADSDLAQEPLKAALATATRWKLHKGFSTLAQKELKMKAREWAQIVEGAKAYDNPGK